MSTPKGNNIRPSDPDEQTTRDARAKADAADEANQRYPEYTSEFEQWRRRNRDDLWKDSRG